MTKQLHGCFRTLGLVAGLLSAGTSAAAFSAADASSQTHTLLGGNCLVSVAVTYDDFFVGAIARIVDLTSGDSATSTGATFENGSIRTSQSYSGEPYVAITTEFLASCLGTTASNISGLVQDGPDGTFATDTRIGFEFTVLADIPGGEAAGTYKFYNDSFNAFVPMPDTTPPTITLGQLTPTGNGTWTSEITLSEAAGSGTAFELADLSLVNATASLLGAETSFTATLTPQSDGYMYVSVQSGAFKDAAGNDSTATTTVSAIVDLTPPVITPPADVQKNTDPGRATASVDVTSLGYATDAGTPTTFDPNYSEKSSLNSFLYAPVVPSVAVPIEYYVPDQKSKLTGAYDFPVGETVVTMIAIDSAGNRSGREQFKVIVSDHEAPTITVPSDQLLSAGPGAETVALDVTVLASATDAVDGTIAPTYMVGSTVLSGLYDFPVGDTRVDVTAADAAGNSAPAASFMVRVAGTEVVTPETPPVTPPVAMDVTAPVITKPSDVTLTADPDETTASYDVTGLGSASDETDGAVAIRFTHDDTELTGAFDFPLGVSTVTMDATDAAGNAATQVSFTVTVSAAEAVLPPVITAATDVTIDTDPAKGTASFDVTVLGTALDSTGTVLPITYMVGETVLDGAYDFPLGATIVTMDAVDENGLAAEQVSITVTVIDDIAPAPAAEVAVVVNADGSITVTGQAEGGSTVTVTFPDGTTVRQILNSLTNAKTAALVPFSITSKNSQPAGEATVVVTDPAGNQSADAKVEIAATVDLAEVHENISGFLQSRASHVVRAQPDLIGLLSGTRGGKFDANVTKDEGSFEFSSAAGQPVWAQLEGSWSTVGALENSYFIGAAGAHYAINPNAIVGVMFEFDKLTQTNGGTTTEGTGYLVGPYFVAKLPDQPLFIEGRYLIGKTQNTVDMDGAFEDSFETDRKLASVKVAGQLHYGKVTLTPNLMATHLSDTQAAFTDDFDRLIAAQEIAVTDVAASLDFSTPIAVPNGAFTLTGGVSGIWSQTTGTGAAADYIAANDGGRARVKLGGSYVTDGGVTFNADAYYDGIGADDYESWGVSVGVTVNF